MKVSLIIPTYRRPEYLRRCVKATAEQTRKPDEVIIVMRDTDVDSGKLITCMQTQYKETLTLKKITVPKHGKSVAINSALEVVTGDIICFTDDDAEPYPDWTERIIEHFKNSTVAGVGGRDIIVKNGKSIEGKCKVVGKMSWFGRCIGNHHLELESETPIETDFLKGVNMTFRTDYLSGFRLDENLKWQGAAHDEMDFCFFVKKRGGKIIFDPRIKVTHYVAPRLWGAKREEFTKNIYEHSHNYTYLILKYFSWPKKMIFLTYFFLVGQRSSWGLFTMLIDPLLRGRIVWWKQVIPSFKGKVDGIRTYLKYRNQGQITHKLEPI